MTLKFLPYPKYISNLFRTSLFIRKTMILPITSLRENILLHYLSLNCSKNLFRPFFTSDFQSFIAAQNCSAIVRKERPGYRFKRYGDDGKGHVYFIPPCGDTPFATWRGEMSGQKVKR